VEFATCGFAVEPPIDLYLLAVDPAVPGSRFAAQRRQVRDAPLAQTLPREQADLDLRLIQPTAMGRRVVRSETVPDLAAELLAAQICQTWWSRPGSVPLIAIKKITLS